VEQRPAKPPICMRPGITAPARRVVDRIAIEHMNHAGTKNGELAVTFDNFEAFDYKMAMAAGN